MTLMCDCGSVALAFEDQQYPDDAPARETYRCESCGQTGTYTFGTQNGSRIDRMTGCLTTDYE